MSTLHGGDAEGIARSARVAASRLVAAGPGLLLIGTRLQTHRAIRLVLDRLPDDRVVVVPFRAAETTTAELRLVIEEARSARPELGFSLMVIEQAHQLKAEQLDELRHAVTDTAQGELRLLLAASRDFAGHTDGATAILPECLRIQYAAPATDRRTSGRPGSGPPPTRPDLSGRGGTVMPVMLVMVGLAIGTGALVAAMLHHRGTSLAGTVAQAPVVAVVAPRPARLAALPAPVVPATVTTPAPPLPAAVRVRRPALHGPSLLLLAAPGDTLPRLYAEVYQGTIAPSYEQVAALNPPVLQPGARLVFPPPPSGWLALPPPDTGSVVRR